MFAHPLDQHAGKIRYLGIRPRLGDVVRERSLGVAPVALELEQDFERELAGQVTPSHRYESSGNLTSPTNTLTWRTSRPSILSIASATCRCTSAATVGTWAECSTITNSSRFSASLPISTRTPLYELLAGSTRWPSRARAGYIPTMPCTWLAVREAMWAITSFATLTEPSGRSGTRRAPRRRPSGCRPGSRRLR